MVRGFQVGREVLDPVAYADRCALCGVPACLGRQRPHPLRRGVLPPARACGDARARHAGHDPDGGRRGRIPAPGERLAGGDAGVLGKVPRRGARRGHALPDARDHRTRSAEDNRRGRDAGDGAQPAERAGAGGPAPLFVAETAGHIEDCRVLPRPRPGQAGAVKRRLCGSL